MSSKTKTLSPKSPNGTKKMKKNVRFAEKKMVRKDYSYRGDNSELYYSPEHPNKNRSIIRRNRMLSDMLNNKLKKIDDNKRVVLVEEEDDGLIKLPANYKHKSKTRSHKEYEGNEPDWFNETFHDVEGKEGSEERKGGKKKEKRARRTTKSRSSRVNRR